MELTQIINQKNNPVNVATAKMQYDEVIVHNNLQDTGNGQFLDVDGKSSVMLYVSGEFVASIYAHGSIDGTTYSYPISIYSITDRRYQANITKAGVYLVENSGFTKMRIRVYKYTSGAVTVTARIFTEALNFYNNGGESRRLVRIAEALGVTCAANSENTLIENIDCSEYVYLFVVSRSNTEHLRKIAFYFQYEGCTLGSPYGDLIAINDANKRSSSERLEPMSDKFNLMLYNNDSAEHTYDVFVYGVR